MKKRTDDDPPWEKPKLGTRVRCRNQRCRSELPIPTDNDHKAFCSRYCYEQFYSWRCKVCENPILKGRRLKSPNHCHDHRCRKDFRRYPEAFGYHPSQTIDYDERSDHFTGLKSAIERSLAGYQIIAGPALSPPERISEAEWRARDLADAKYVAKDEARLRKLANDYPNLDWPSDDDAPEEAPYSDLPVQPAIPLVPTLTQSSSATVPSE